ncbi:MAG TPA: response regulator transcription factor [Candidatus Limnocylindrales bacterium]|nr:response regulator transcription factor [Candidatus Limnocylindrales bacterium]
MTDLVSPAPVQASPAASGGPTVVVVDADDRTRESLVRLLGVHDRCRVVGSAGRPAEALTVIRREQPDVVVVDPRLPDLAQGLAFIRRVRAVSAGGRILGMASTPGLEPDVRAAGADGFLRKTFRPQELAEAVARCARSVPPEAERSPGR